MNLLAGTLLKTNSYKILRFISSGGFGCTYEAVHTLLNKRVAIKEFFPKDFCNRDETTNQVVIGTLSQKPLVDKLRRKFIDEARVISKMKHPNIVSVLDFFEENGTAYYVMDYINGLSLQNLLSRRGTLSENEASKYIVQIANALKYVHSLNRLHLDIKPGNIMIDEQDNAVLIDFGTSKHYDEQSGENTTTLMKVYTEGYAPIELYSASFTNFSPPTDIYSLGATFYSLLTGQRPLPANIVASGIDQKKLPSTVRESVQNAINKSLKLSRADRPQTIDEFLAILEISADEATILDNNQEQEITRRTRELCPEMDIEGALESNKGLFNIGYELYNTHKAYDLAVYWYRKSADLGDKASQNNLGICYENGRGVEKDLTKAVELYRKSAEQGDKIAQNNLGLCYEYGKSVEKDLTEATYWYEKAAIQGHVSAQNNLAKCYSQLGFKNQNPQKTYYWYKKSADQGDSVGQYELGNCYYSGRGIKQDLSEAVFWYRKSAEQGNKHAQERLGRCYENGEGIEEDESKAFFWYKKLAEQGNDVGQYIVGNCYYYGHGVTQNYYDAFAWYEKSANNGNVNSKNQLGECYHNGYGVGKNEEEAFKWFKEALYGNANATYRMGMFYHGYYGGKLVEPDPYLAFTYFLNAAEHGHLEAQYQVAMCYEFGYNDRRAPEYKGILGISKSIDTSKVIYWYKKAAERGHEGANRSLRYDYPFIWLELEINKDDTEVQYVKKNNPQNSAEVHYILGNYYENSGLVPQNLEDAVKWYEHSAREGNKEATEALKRLNLEKWCEVHDLYVKDADARYTIGTLYEKGEGVPKDMKKAIKFYKRSAEQYNYDAIDAVKRLDPAQWKSLHVVHEDSFALCHLATLYEKGEKVKQDLRIAERYYRFSAIRGCEKANEALKRLKSYSRHKASNAQRIESEAHYILATFYETGEVIPQDLSKAIEFYEFSAEMGNKKATDALKLLEPVKWYNLRENREHAEAQFYVGTCFEKGENIEQNITQAVKYYQLSANQGYEKAVNAIERLDPRNINKSHTLNIVGVAVATIAFLIYDYGFTIDPSEFSSMIYPALGIVGIIVAVICPWYAHHATQKYEEKKKPLSQWNVFWTLITGLIIAIFIVGVSDNTVSDRGLEYDIVHLIIFGVIMSGLFTFAVYKSELDIIDSWRGYTVLGGIPLVLISLGTFWGAISGTITSFGIFSVFLAITLLSGK